MKYLNQWSFINRDGSKLSENTVTAAIENLEGKSKDEIIRWLEDTVLPTEIRGWVFASNSTEIETEEILKKAGFKIYEDQTERKFETTKDGLVEYTSPTCKWGHVKIEWENYPDKFNDGKEFTIRAKIPIVSDGGDQYIIYVNSNNSADYISADGIDKNAPKDTAKNPDILSLKVTLKNIDLEKHVVSPANPENVTVNLFDYWVKEKNPTVETGGDILNKSDSHYHEEGGEGQESTTATKYSAKDDWNLGINKNHLLLFGDGLIHAGLWNKGAGENCRYGKAYAGMEGIVKNVLSNNGYPEMNLEMANKILMGDSSKNYTWIKDYKLTGDHNNTYGDQYNSDNIQNISNTVIGTWGGDINTNTESLQYLFDPSNDNGTNGCKKSYTDVKGLFQLDNDGYYYYNMRKNFAEFSQDGGKNHFILYDAGATTRTDGDDSIGNFFPFNKGSEVFNGVGTNASGEEILTSSVSCSRNNMNHHLGMTVDVAFRQPVGGNINSGSSSKPMTFEFAGDDDVWVFIDDVLVLDIGGIHSELYGTINFATGDVYIGRAFGTKGIPANPAGSDKVTHTTLLKLFTEAGKKGELEWNGNTFASNTSHELKMFYLERGNYDSSIALRFNLQPLLPQQIEKVDQNGDPVSGVTFNLYPTKILDTGNSTNAIECLYTDGQVNGKPFWVEKIGENATPLVTLKTGADGVDGVGQFKLQDGSYFNFADRGDQYYILREVTAPAGYRKQPIDIVLHYDPNTSMLSVANRWTTGAYACSVSNVIGPIAPNYGVLNQNSSGNLITNGSDTVSLEEQRGGLVVAVPMLLKKSKNNWMALYGSNLSGFDAIEVDNITEEGYKEAILRAALNQATGKPISNNQTKRNYEAWHLDWDAGNNRLTGRLSDLPGLASRYRVNNGSGDMQMVYGIISPAALKAALKDINIEDIDADARYKALGNCNIEKAFSAIMGTEGGFRFLNVEQFNRTFRSLIYIPNERRELWVQKVDQDGNSVEGATFGLFKDSACNDRVAYGRTDADGMLIFSPTGDNSPGHAQMIWANSDVETRYYLKEIAAPSSKYQINDTVIPIVVGIYSIYADAGTKEDGVSVMAGVGRLTQSMRQYAISDNVDITLRDITAIMQVQPSDSFGLTNWVDTKLEGTEIPRSMNLHFGKNAVVDYGLHDEDGGKIFKPYFVTDSGYIRARVKQNYPALTGQQYAGEGSSIDANKDNLGDTDLTNLFSLLNIVVVTDQTNPDTDTGKLTISKKLIGSGLAQADYTKNFSFKIEFKNPNGTPLDGKYEFYGDDKVGMLSNGDTLLLHHDESVTILGLPVGTKFVVTEINHEGWFVDPESYEGTISKEDVFVAIYENSKDPYYRPTPTPSPTKTPGPTSTPDPKSTPGTTPTPKKPEVPKNPKDLTSVRSLEQGPVRPNVPDTGDFSQIEMWVLLGGLSLLLLSAFWFVVLRRKNTKKTM